MAASGREPPTTAVVEVAMPGPLDIPASVERFRRWGDDLLDRWDGTTFVRVAYAADAWVQPVPYACTLGGTVQAPRVRVAVNTPAEVELAIGAVQTMWGPCPPDALEELASRDTAIARCVALYPGIRPIIHADGFSALVRSISAQQVNLSWAATTRRRLAERFGRRHQMGHLDVYSLAPDALAEATVDDLRRMQFTTRKAEYLVGLARAVLTRSLDLAALAQATDDEVLERLCAVRGLGRWTAEWYLARTLGRPVVVAGDLAVRKAVGGLYQTSGVPGEREVRALTAHWGAAAALAQELVLYALGHGMFSARPPGALSPARAE